MPTLRLEMRPRTPYFQGFDGEYRKTTDGIIDMDATIAQFRKAEELLKSVHEIA
jgi:hypothetical protein